MDNMTSSDEQLSKSIRDIDLPGIKRALEQGANIEFVDKWGNAPLLIAVEHEIVPAAEILLQHGASPNSAAGANLPLQLAIDVAVQITNGHDDVEFDSTEMIELLLKYGCTSSNKSGQKR